MLRIAVCIADVPMLIDSGADLTLLPATVVEQLGLEVPKEHDYELEGFDGSKTVAQSVKLELAFLTDALRDVLSCLTRRAES